MSRIQKKAFKQVLMVYFLLILVGMISIYLLVYRPLRKRSIDTFRHNLSFVVEQVDGGLDMVKEYANYVAYSETVKEAVQGYIKNKSSKNKFELETVLYTKTFLNNRIRSMALHVQGEDAVYSLIPPSQTEKDRILSDAYISQHNLRYGSFYLPGNVVLQDNKRVVRTFSYSQKYNYGNIIFTLTLFIDFDEIFGSVVRYTDIEFDTVNWLLSDGSLLFSDSEKEKVYCKNYMQKYELAKEGLILNATLNNSSYRLNAFISKDKLNNSFYSYFDSVVLIMIMFLLISLYLVIRLIRSMTKPIVSLAKTMENAVDKKLQVRVSINLDDEIGDLYKAFNTMMDDVEDHVGEMVKKEEKEQQMRAGLLISQIDPHFICNTLNSAIYLARQERSQDVIVVCSALSGFLRDRLRVNLFQIIDSVQQEVEATKNYLKIQSYRYGTAADVVWNISPNVLNYEILKNTIQVLVENALIHGLSSEIEGTMHGNISIDINEQDKNLFIVVEDNGRGMSEQIKTKILQNVYGKDSKTRGHGIGLTNTIELYRLLYGDDFILNIKSAINVGTKVEIIIPTQKKPKKIWE